jgi:hypothetical protein
MIRTGGTRVNGEDWNVWRFPGQWESGAKINKDGSGVALSSRSFGHK